MCIKHLGSISDFCASNLGLFQGEITSPICFSLFLNDIELHLQNEIGSCLTLNEISIHLLLFTDDAAILSEYR